MKNKLIYILILIVVLIACVSKKKKEIRYINNKADELFNGATFLLMEIGFQYGNIDSLRDIYIRIPNDSAHLRYSYALKLKLKFAILKDSINDAKIVAEKKAWYSTHAGKLQIQHPEWTREECQKILERQIWIGMSIDMVIYLRGYQYRRNVSNYGSGERYQYCWDSYTPSCFYCGSDGVVTSYN